MADEADYVDPYAHLAGVDIDAMAVVGAFRHGGSTAMWNAYTQVMERRGSFRGMPIVARVKQMLSHEELAHVLGRMGQELKP
jgi:hypothetical protein